MSGMFANGGAGQAIAGTIGDYLMQLTGMKPMYAPMMQQRQKMQMEEQDYQRKREDTMADWTQQQQWKADHDKPEYGEFERALIASGVQPGTDPWAAAMKRRADNMLDPIVNTIQGPVLRSMVTGGMGAPTQPVGSLTPIDDEGGAGSQAPRPFPY